MTSGSLLLLASDESDPMKEFACNRRYSIGNFIPSIKYANTARANGERSDYWDILSLGTHFYFKNKEKDSLRLSFTESNVIDTANILKGTEITLLYSEYLKKFVDKTDYINTLFLNSYWEGKINDKSEPKIFNKKLLIHQANAGIENINDIDLKCKKIMRYDPKGAGETEKEKLFKAINEAIETRSSQIVDYLEQTYQIKEKLSHIDIK